jgi:hypothetical protein
MQLPPLPSERVRFQDAVSFGWWFWARRRKTKILVARTESVSKSRRCIYVSFGNFPRNFYLTSVLKVILPSAHGSLDYFLIFVIQISELQIIDKSG